MPKKETVTLPISIDADMAEKILPVLWNAISEAEPYSTPMAIAENPEGTMASNNNRDMDVSIEIPGTGSVNITLKQAAQTFSGLCRQLSGKTEAVFLKVLDIFKKSSGWKAGNDGHSVYFRKPCSEAFEEWGGGYVNIDIYRTFSAGLPCLQVSESSFDNEAPEMVTIIDAIDESGTLWTDAEALAQHIRDRIGHETGRSESEESEEDEDIPFS